MPTTEEKPQCRYLTGENVRPANMEEAAQLIGVNVRYIRRIDARTGAEPRVGTIDFIKGRCVTFDCGTTCRISDLLEVSLDVNGETNHG